MVYKITLSFLFHCVVFIFVVYYGLYQADMINSSCQNVSLKNGEEVQYKRVLIANTYWWFYKTWQKILIRHINGQCPETRCIFHTNLSDIENADAVLFNAPNLPTRNRMTNFPIPLLSQKSPNQIWILMTAEPPPNIYRNVNLTQFGGYFNWTMSYRRDSDIVMPYGEIIKKADAMQGNLESLIPNDPKKGKLVTWMVSRCISFSKREDFVKELKRYISVDIYGDCGKPCGVRSTVPNLITGSKDACQETLQDYKFYLALENAICKDYITEKFFRALKIGLIPIVIGGIDYRSIAPENSYIDAKNFETIEQLANYIQKVADNRDLFLKFHEWRRFYDIDIGLPFAPMICDLCKKLHSTSPDDKKQKVYDDLRLWAIDESQCTTWKMGLEPIN